MKNKIVKPIIGITLSSIVVGLFFIAFYDQNSEDEILKKQGVYGTAVVIKTTNNFRGKKSVFYEYIVRDTVYKASDIYYTTEEEVVIGGKYKLLYYPKNPNIERIVLDQKIE